MDLFSEEVGEGEDGGWKLYEDRKGKPGWISETANTTIRFHVNFKDKNNLKIGFLRSYEGIGRVGVSVLKPGESWAPEVILDGHIEEHFSQIYIERFCAFCKIPKEKLNEDHMMKGWEIKGGPAEVNIRNLDNKKSKLVFIIPF